MVKAYYECAYFRFVDVVSASVQCELFTKCRNDIITRMKEVFGLFEPDGMFPVTFSGNADTNSAEQRLALLLAANPQQETRRAQLLKEKETIAKAQERLEGLGDAE